MENEMEMEITAEDIAAMYAAMLDSVAFVNSVDAGDMDEMFEDEEEKTDARTRNVEHLQLMVAKDFWTNEDMSSVNAVI